jgi:putative inorganic carbon (HCO3(-)) transporter
LLHLPARAAFLTGIQTFVTHFGRSLTFAGFAALYTYLVMMGGTYDILNVPTRLMSLALVILIAGGWLFARFRNRWPWPSTPLDGPFLLWLGAIALSVLLNPLPWRREMIGGWFVLLYMALWYLLSDLLARGVLRRSQLMQIIPIGSIAVVALGFFQSRVWLFEQLPRILSGDAPFSLARPGSTLGNPNSLAAILVVVVPFVLVLALRARGTLRLILLVYTGLCSLLMFLTFSRGGWVGLALALVVMALLLLYDRGALNPEIFWRWWGKQNASIRAGVITTLLVGVLLVLAVLILGLVSLGQGGRSLDLRTYIYSAAINLFAEQPIAGQGLFTFGRGLAAQASTPPYSPHSHAHNMILHVAAELGIAGLVALLATLLATLRALRANWQAAGRNERMLLSGAFAAVAGFVAHHMLDFPAMVPVIAITGMIALAAAAAPTTSLVTVSVTRGRMTAGLVLVGCAMLIISGVITALIYVDYAGAVYHAAGTAEYRVAAERLQTVIERDPDLAVTYYQQGFLYGLAASDGDESAQRPAIEAFREYVYLEPSYVIGWLNLGALYTQNGDTANAVGAYRAGVNAAPEDWVAQYQLARAEEAVGNTDTARAIYQYIMENSVAELPLYPDFPGTPLRDSIAADFEPSGFSRVALLLADGDADAARALWDTIDKVPDDYGTLALESWFAVTEGRYDDAAALRAQLAPWAVTPDGKAWMAYLEALSARAQGDTVATDAALETARAALYPGPLEPDDGEMANIHYVQFLHTAIPRQYLPQIGYPLAGPLITHLLAQEP